MNSRERVKKAIHFQQPDQVPHFLPDGKENDLLWLWPFRPDKMPWTLQVDGNEQRIDAWGTVYARTPGSCLAHGEKIQIAIPDIQKQSEYIFPDFHIPETFNNIKLRINQNITASNPKYCLGVMPYSSLNEGTHNLVELDKMFLAYYESPEALKGLIKRLADAQMEDIRILAGLGCDGVMAGDDWGLQNQQMVGLDLIKEFFMPLYRRNWAYAHSFGMDVWMHSCGYIIDLLPDFKDWGLDVIQQDQQENMGLENLDVKVGGKLAFWCPVDIQKTMVEGSNEDIRAYVRRIRNTVGNHNGGMISMAYSTPASVGHTLEKTEAMCDEFRKLKGY